MKRILTIQDISCVGQCSLTVALPIISAMGIETCILPSAILSTHTGGFTGYTFKDLTEDLPLIKDHWVKEKITFDGIYTGYVGSIKQLEYIKNIIDTFNKDGNIVLVDPCMADNGKLYPGFKNEFPQEMKKLCAYANCIVPNITEACFLLGKPYKESFSQIEIEQMAKELLEIGCKNVVIKGVSFEKEKLGICTYDGKTFNYYFKDLIPYSFHGTGDIWASSFYGALIRGNELLKSAIIATDFTVSAMKYSIDDRISHPYGVHFELALPKLIESINIK